MPQRTEVVLVYGTALVQALALVTFPAASSIFTSSDGYGFSASRYGMMFVPQVILAILASSLGPRLARRWTLKRVLRAGMSADLLAMILLALSRLLQGFPDAAYGILLVATGSLGFGFGSVVMALNTYSEEFSPGREDRAVLALNALLGAGTALAPLLVAIFIGLRAGWLLPLAVAGALAGLLLISAREPLVASAGRAADTAVSERFPPRFWLFAAAVLLYGIAETLNGNWSGLYLTGERGISVGGTSLALTAFWAMVTIGRVLFAVVSSNKTVRWIYLGLPVLLIVAFQGISHVRGDPNLLRRQFSHREIYPAEMGCKDPIDSAVGTPLGGTTLIHMCVDYDEMEIALWLLDHGMDVNARSAVGASGFGGYTALFATVVSQPNFWMNYEKRGPFVAPYTKLLLDRGADANIRASIWKQLHPGHGDTTRHEYRDVTALSWGRQFHAPILVSQPALQLIEDAGGVE